MQYTLDELTYQLTVAARSRGRKTLHTTPEVTASLKEAFPPSDRDSLPPWIPGAPAGLAPLMGVEIYEDPEMTGREFRLIRHDGCHVNVETQEVHHGHCPVTASGELTAATTDKRHI